MTTKLKGAESFFTEAHLSLFDVSVSSVDLNNPTGK